MGFVKLLIRGKWKEMSLRYQVVNNRLPDPFDTYDYLDSLHQTYGLSPHFLFYLLKEVVTIKTSQPIIKTLSV